MDKQKVIIPILIVLFTMISEVSAQSNLNIYGYFSTRLERIYSRPDYQDGEIMYENSNVEWQYPYLHIMFQNSLSDQFKVFLNLNGGGTNELEKIDIRNVWGEYSYSNALKLRVGKSYRKFEIFNEILDAVPTYYGIEPPQYLNPEHEIMNLYPRLTTAMIYGGLNAGEGSLNYALSIDKGISEAYSEAFPFSLDLHYNLPTDAGSVIFGAAGYSTGGEVSFEGEEEEDDEDAEIESGNGILPWMQQDEFSVFGGYLEAVINNFTIQAGYWHSPHTAIRNTEVMEDYLSEKTNEEQASRFLIDKEGEIEEDNIIPEADYAVNTWYVRVGYSFYTEIGEIAPYAHWDYYSNPELVGLETLDEEHNGIPDEGAFHLATIGLLYRPIPSIAVKFDLGYHMYDYYNEAVKYPELKLDFSFLFGQL